MSHYHDSDPCPVLYVQVGENNIFSVLESLGKPFGEQNQISASGVYCLLLRANAMDYPELEQFKIPLSNVDEFLKNVGPDPAAFTLIQAREVIQCPEWRGAV